MIPADATPDPEVRRELRGVAGQFATGVTIVLTMSDDEPHATTANSFVVVSTDPPLIAVLFAHGTRMGTALRASGRFGVSVLGAADHTLARRFARPDRPSGWAGLAGIELVRRDPAPPVLARAIAWLDCAVRQVVPMGDHDCFVGEVLALGRDPDAAPLVYYRGGFHALGRAAAPAPWSTLERDDLAADW